MDFETNFSAILPYILTVIGTLLVVLVGSYLTHKSAKNLFYLRHKIEIMETTYSRLMGLKGAWTQAIRTNLEASMLSEFYDFRYNKLSNVIEDLNEAKIQNNRAISLIPMVANLQREVFETLGNVRIAYEIDEKLNTYTNALYNFKLIEIKPPPNEIKSQDDLIIWKEKVCEVIKNYLDKEFNAVFENLFPLLLEQIQRCKK